MVSSRTSCTDTRSFLGVWRRIFAEPITITGSIGVFGVIPYTGKMLSNKLGLTFDRASTNKHAVMTLNRKLTDDELKLIQSEVDDIYLQFLGRVAEGRGMTIAQVNKIARGRVWTGRDALKIGLVDKLGGISDAIEYAAKTASIKERKIVYYPEVKEDPISEIIEKIGASSEASASFTSTELPSVLMEYYSQLKKLENFKGIQMRLPYEIVFK